MEEVTAILGQPQDGTTTIENGEPRMKFGDTECDIRFDQGAKWTEKSADGTRQIQIGFNDGKVAVVVYKDSKLSKTKPLPRTESPTSSADPADSSPSSQTPDSIRPPRRISAKVWRRDGHAVVEIGKLTVEFENISMDGEDALLGTVQDLHCPLPVESGSRQVPFGDDLTMKESLKDGIATISFNETSFQLIEDASKVRFGEQNFAVEEERTIVVAENGKVSVKTD